MTQTIFTQNEKIAIADVLIQIMNADNDIDDAEVLYMAQLRAVLGLTTETLDKAKGQDPVISLQTITVLVMIIMYI